MRLLLSQVASACSAEWNAEDKIIESVSIDSRCIDTNALFVAIPGERVDGHDYAQMAVDNGAVAVLAEKKIDISVPCLLVDNSVEALQKIAAFARGCFKGKVVAITGSSGKTSTKEMLASILAYVGRVTVTSGNQNNEIGVPLTVLAIDNKADFAVVEMGAAQIGDIEKLMQIARPDVSVITNIGTAHIGRFGSEENIAIAKSEIYRHLAEDAMAVINLDDSHAVQWQTMLHKHKTISCSMKLHQADIRASDIHIATGISEFDLHYKDKNVSVTLPVPGKHNIANALCAAACAVAVGADLSHIKSGLNNSRTVNARLQEKQTIGGAILLDDSYNANPESVRAAVDVLSARAGRRFLVLGDMAELGVASCELHKGVGLYAKEKGVDQLLCWGSESSFASEAFGQGAQSFPEKNALADYLVGNLKPGDVVLVKGSRSAQMEEIVRILEQKAAG